MHRVLVLAALVACACAQASCFLREYEWTADTDGTWFADIDAGDNHPILLELHDVSLAPVDVNPCVRAATSDFVTLAWDRLPFAQFPTACHDKHGLYFGVSSLGSNKWGDVTHSPTDGTVYAPQMGRVDMATATATPSQVPPRFRRLRMWMVSGGVRAPLGPFTLESCVLGGGPIDLDAATRTITMPRLLPIAGCVHAFGGHCGVNVGWVNMDVAPVELAAHSEDNRLSPASLENGWTLPSTFDTGVHVPDSFKPLMRLSWACDLGGAAAPVEVKWHLDGRTLHLDGMARRCATEMVAPGHTLVTSEVAADNERAKIASWQAAADSATVSTQLAEQSERPHVAQTAHEVAVANWREAGVEFPYMSRISAEQHAAANVAAVSHHRARDSDDDSDCDSTCQAWIAFGIFAAFFIIMGIIFLIFWCFYGDYGWYGWPHAHAPHAWHPRETPEEYERLHGHPREDIKST